MIESILAYLGALAASHGITQGELILATMVPISIALGYSVAVCREYAKLEALDKQWRQDNAFNTASAYHDGFLSGQINATNQRNIRSKR